MTVNYRNPKTDDILPIPDDLALSPREQIILATDIRVAQDGVLNEEHWQAVADALTAQGYCETHASVKSVKRRFMQKLRMYSLRQVANANILNDIIPRDREVTINDRKAAMQALLGSTYESQTHEKESRSNRRILVVSDYHGSVHPFIQKSLLSDDYDICIHAGDILDMHRLHKARIEGKSLTAMEKDASLDEELQIMRAWFELLDEKTTAQHIVLMGNHDARLESLFIKHMDAYIRSESLLRRMFRTPLELLTEGLNNFTVGQREMLWMYPDLSIVWAANSQFIYQLGDVLISHMNNTGKPVGSAVQKLWAWVQSYQDVLQLHDIRLCLQAHTHSLSLDKNCQGGHVNLVETGCAMTADRLGYGLVYNGNWSPSAVGYVSFEQYYEQDAWKTYLGSVQLHGIEG